VRDGVRREFRFWGMLSSIVERERRRKSVEDGQLDLIST
jgi:hypothetical protein